MTEVDWKDRIAVNPNVCFGKPCTKGTRIWGSLVLDFLASSSTVDEILRKHPHLTRDDIQAGIATGTEAERERFIPMVMEGRG
ncbi:MAG: DUF433 domain-containing protein [Planctomycetes bacterium]|nr:DUF433 domain-containing protein [Planctomycetota bacterium]